MSGYTTNVLERPQRRPTPPRTVHKGAGSTLPSSKYNSNDAKKRTGSPETARFLKQRRLALGLTQKELEKAWGQKSQSSISDIENGVRGIEREDIPSLALALQMSQADVMAAAGYLPEPAAISPPSSRFPLVEGKRITLIDDDGKQIIKYQYDLFEVNSQMMYGLTDTPLNSDQLRRARERLRENMSQGE